MIVNLYGAVDNEMLSRFFDFYNKSKNEDITIYLSSEGGNISVQDAIVDLINQQPQRFTLIACEQISSAAFNIFFMVNCKKRLTKGTVGMAHFSWMEIAVSETGKPSTENEKFMLKEIKKAKEQSMKFFRELGFTTAELNKLKKGTEVFLSYERMTELLKNQQNG